MLQVQGICGGICCHASRDLILFSGMRLFQCTHRRPLWKATQNRGKTQGRTNLTSRPCLVRGDIMLSFIIFFPSEPLKIPTLISAFCCSFFLFSKETYTATSSNLFQMDLVIEWLIIHSVVCYVVKLKNLHQTAFEPCFMVSSRKDNP